MASGQGNRGRAVPAPAAGATIYGRLGGAGVKGLARSQSARCAGKQCRIRRRQGYGETGRDTAHLHRSKRVKVRDALAGSYSTNFNRFQ